MIRRFCHPSDRTMSDPLLPAEPPPGDALLAQADAVHDTEPANALEMLRHVDAASLSTSRLPRLAFLLNHVLGEKFELWAEAFSGQRAVIAAAGPSTPAVLLRQAAVAAQIAGERAQAHAWVDALAADARAPVATAQALVNLAAAGFAAGRQDAETAGRLALRALAPLAALHAAPGTALDTAFAAVANNIASDLLDRPLDDLAQPDLRTALALCAEHSQRFWQRAGTWVNIERAHYLRALAANALGDGTHAAAHARAGLDVLDTNDTAHAEDVDRAFIALELAQGLDVAGMHGADEARQHAEALAARFAQAWLTGWFASRVARNVELRAHYGRGWAPASAARTMSRE
jgi:hypothetical protein